MADYAVLLQDARARTVRMVFELTGVVDEIIDASSLANLDDEHDPEGATVAFERAQASELLGRAQAQLAEVDAALGRLRRGTYGVCERCGTKIPADRLEAQPATRCCVGCATRAS
jgi:RNA polymerase-binding transcription factor DksA